MKWGVEVVVERLTAGALREVLDANVGGLSIPDEARVNLQPRGQTDGPGWRVTFAWGDQ